MEGLIEKVINTLPHTQIHMETVTIPKHKFEKMKEEIKTLRNSKLYRRLLEFERNISQGKKYSRKELGY